MRLGDLYLWYLGDPATPRYVGALKLVCAGKGANPLEHGRLKLASAYDVLPSARSSAAFYRSPIHLATACTTCGSMPLKP
jgi:hypothetical protein